MYGPRLLTYTPFHEHTLSVHTLRRSQINVWKYQTTLPWSLFGDFPPPVGFLPPVLASTNKTPNRGSGVMHRVKYGQDSCITATITIAIAHNFVSTS